MALHIVAETFNVANMSLSEPIAAVTRTALAHALVSKCGLKQPYSSELVNKRKRPSLTLASEIETKLGIPARAWADETFLVAYWERLRKQK